MLGLVLWASYAIRVGCKFRCLHTDNQTAKRVQIVVGIGKKVELSRNKDEETDIETNRYDNTGRVWKQESSENAAL